MSWEPATETERRMQDVLRQGDQESYFLLLSRGELYIPVAPGNSAWATWSTDDRTHVLAFTSEGALRSCLREHSGPSRRIGLDELVQSWPDEDWWLAVNPGLPIEGYLPSWFIGQVAAGDASIPDDESAPEPDLMPAYGGGTGYENGGDSAYPQYGAEAPAYRRPAHAEEHREPAFPADTGYGAAPEPAYGRQEPYGSPEPAYGQTEQPAYGASAESAYGRPEPAYGTPEPAYGAGESLFTPAAPPPEPDGGSLFAPAAPPPDPVYPDHSGYGSEHGYGQSDYGRADTGYAPPAEQHEPEPPAPAGYGREDDRGEEPQHSASGLPMRRARDPQSYSSTEQAFAPPEPHYGGHDAYEDRQQPYEPGGFQDATGEAAYGGEPYAPPPAEASPEPPEPHVTGLQPAPVRAAAAPVYDPGPVPGGMTEDEIENELAAAAGGGDTPRFLRALLSGWVYVPLNDGAGVGVRPGDPGFTWRTDLIDGAYSLTVFTSPTRMARRLGPCEFVKVTFVRVARNWPDRSYSLAINPGTEVGANMPGTQMQTLISWATKKGLLDQAEQMERAAVPMQALPAGGHAPAEAEQRKLEPTLLQKLIPAAQVPFYLQRGYDRIAGFVHPAGDLAHFDTPETLRSALGLPHDGASDVYVIRWISHRADLYRVPYGGNSDEDMRRMDGWVIEPPPFRGNGFAPGDPASMVAEYKVDSIRLPHGATMHRLSSIDGDTLVASFDADQQTWLTAEESL